MASDQKNSKGASDDPRQAFEEGDPKASGRVRGHVANEQEEIDRANPDASRGQGQRKQDANAPTPDLESGDRA